MTLNWDFWETYPSLVSMISGLTCISEQFLSMGDQTTDPMRKLAV
jgi:hypothetical protein